MPLKDEPAAPAALEQPASEQPAPREGMLPPAQTIESIELGQRVSAVNYIDALFYCYSPAHQVSTYYRSGMVDMCQDSLENVKRVMKLKMNYSVSEKELFLKQIHRTDDASRGSAGVWKEREDPQAAWAWKAEEHGETF